MDPQLAHDLERRLSEYQLDLTGGVLPLSSLEPEQACAGQLERNGERAARLVIYSPTMTADSLPRRESSDSATVLLLGERIHERSAEALRLMGVDYLDAAGNAHISFGRVLVDVRGRRLPTPKPGAERPAKATVSNLFSPKRAQVIFAFLTWPQLLSAPLREVARVAGVSIGKVHDTNGMLEALGFIDAHSPGRLLRADKLFDGWADAHAARLRASGASDTFAGAIDDLVIPEGAHVAVSGEYAIPEFLRPTTLTVYSDRPAAELAVANRWRRSAEANIFVRSKFWQPLDEGAPVPRQETAPATLVYADLIAAGESRQAEGAQWLRERDDRLQFA